jgi:transcriptional regulator with XRE-family HTH domain
MNKVEQFEQRGFYVDNRVSQGSINVLNTFPSVRLVCHLGTVLENLGLTQYDLSEMSGIRLASINELIMNRKNHINKLHIVPIMLALKITDLSEIYTFEFDEEDTIKMEEQHNTLHNLGNIPEENLEIMEENKESFYHHKKKDHLKEKMREYHHANKKEAE